MAQPDSLYTSPGEPLKLLSPGVALHGIEAGVPFRSVEAGIPMVIAEEEKTSSPKKLGVETAFDLQTWTVVFVLLLALFIRIFRQLRAKLASKPSGNQPGIIAARPGFIQRLRARLPAIRRPKT